MKLSFENTKNKFQIYIDGKSLKNHLTDSTICAVEKDGAPHPIVANDIKIRLNNWSEVKASILTKTTFMGVGFGFAFALLTTGLVQTFSNRR
jgi:hypothetical protein